MKLIESKKFKRILIEEFEQAEKVIIFSAYLTFPAVQLLIERLHSLSSVIVVVRSNIEDFYSGAIDIFALELLVENNVLCYISNDLHAKIYCFNDSYAYIGSANFTSNGLNVGGIGNIELSTKISLDSEDLSLLYDLVNKSVHLTSDRIGIIKDYIDDLRKDETKLGYDSLVTMNHLLGIKDKVRDLCYSDLPWSEPKSGNICEHDKTIFKIDNNSNELTESKIFLFILQYFESENKEQIYFGELTRLIRSALADDIDFNNIDLRLNVSYLYEYIDMFARDIFIVDRPRYSQRLRILR